MKDRGWIYVEGELGIKGALPDSWELIYNNCRFVREPAPRKGRFS